MNILLINHYAGSIRHGMEYRPYYLAREWTRMGHSVTIAAATHSHVRTQPPDLDGMVTREQIDGISYLWFKTTPYNGNGIARAINIFSFVGQLLRYKTWLARIIQPELVIASSTYPLDMVAARAIARKSGARLIFEVHDLWPLSPIELGGMSRHHPFILLMQWAENYAYRHADRVISLLPNAKEYMLEHGMAPHKYVHIPNGVSVAEWLENGEAISETEQALTELRAKGQFIVGYTGAHGLANALDHFVDAALLLQDYPVTFVLVGHGPEKARLQAKVQARRQNNVLFMPSLEKKTMPSVLQAMDAVYIGLTADPLFRFGVSPNKLIDYLMAARPVISAIRAGNDLVAESGCGISVPPEDCVAIARAVLTLMNLSEGTRKRLGKKGQEHVLANHDYRILAANFVRAVSQASQ